MITLVFIIIFGVIFSYFATINTGLITIDFGVEELPNVPIYLAVLVSAAIGMLLAAILHFLKSIGSYFSFGEKEKDLKQANERIADLTRELHKLELENTKLKAGGESEEVDDDSLG